MRECCKKSFSFLLALCILFTLIPAGAAAEMSGGTYEEGQSYFDFEASEYSAVEDDGELEIRILRHGEGSTPANVALKAANFLSAYGQDYEILLDGKPLSMEKGETISAADFAFDGGDSEASAESVMDAEAVTETESVAERVETDEITPNTYMAAADIEPEDAEAVTEEAETVADAEAATEEAESVTDAEAVTEEAESVTDTEAVTEEAESVTDAEGVTEAAETVTDGEDVTDEAETVAESALELKKAESQENPDKKAKISANSLRDAQREYLQIPEDSKAQRAAHSAEDLFKELHTFFQNAQGAQGIVYFAPGVRERTLTVRVIDNDDADGNRMFLLGLLGTDTLETTIAVNATTYVTIEDDENRESAVYSISAEHTILSPDNPTATVKVRRGGGTQYFGTAFISTVKETALSTAYGKLDLKPVGFTPGQSEAEVTVTALDFTDGGEFGVRLETQAPDTERNNYITFVIEGAEADAPKTEESASELPSGAEADDAQLLAMASGRVLGSSSIAYGNHQSNSFSSFPGGWATEITGGDRDNRASMGSQFYIVPWAVSSISPSTTRTTTA